MTDADRQRLAAILGMLGSEHQGERDNAAQQAEAFRKRQGQTWSQLLKPVVINIPPRQPEKLPQPKLPYEWSQVAMRACFWAAIVFVALTFR